MNIEYSVDLIRRANAYSQARTEAEGGPPMTVYQPEVMGWLAGYTACSADQNPPEQKAIKESTK